MLTWLLGRWTGFSWIPPFAHTLVALLCMTTPAFALGLRPGEPGNGWGSVMARPLVRELAQAPAVRTRKTFDGGAPERPLGAAFGERPFAIQAALRGGVSLFGDSNTSFFYRPPPVSRGGFTPPVEELRFRRNQVKLLPSFFGSVAVGFRYQKLGLELEALQIGLTPSTPDQNTEDKAQGVHKVRMEGTALNLKFSPLAEYTYGRTPQGVTLLMGVGRATGKGGIKASLLQFGISAPFFELEPLAARGGVRALVFSRKKPAEGVPGKNATLISAWISLDFDG